MTFLKLLLGCSGFLILFVLVLALLQCRRKKLQGPKPLLAPGPFKSMKPILGGDFNPLTGERGHVPFRVRRLLTDPGPDKRARWKIPLLDTPDQLWQWLELSGFGELAKLCDPDDLQLLAAHQPRTDSFRRLLNYHVRRVPKRGGGERILLVPKPRLKAVQRKILREILDKVPVHSATTGFRKGRDIGNHAAVHTGKAIVLACDIADFFPSIHKPRVSAFFRWLGYPPPVAHLLSLLCTAADGTGFTRRHLPQGAPTSPALANAICFRLDARLAGLAKQFEADYTRYADDLAFSGGKAFKGGLDRFIPVLRKILADERFLVRRSKTRFMRAGTRQHLTGLNINHMPSLGRREYDTLKAILTNAERAGSVESQNRDSREHFEAYLRGRIAWYRRFHPERGGRLMMRLDALARVPPPSVPPPE